MERVANEIDGVELGVADFDAFLVGPGIDGALMRRFEGGPGIINTFGVPSVDECLARVARSGGVVVTPKAAIPGAAYVAYCADPEGNIFGIMELNDQAR